jgi:hypothetical protein
MPRVSTGHRDQINSSRLVLTSNSRYAPGVSERSRILAGDLAVPRGWEVSTEIRIIEPPAPAIAAPLSAKKGAEKSRASVTVSRYDAEHADAAGAMKSFLKTIAAHASNLKTIEEGTLAFDDGAEGPFSIVRYDVQPGRQVAQCHAFRLDGATVSHLTATVEAFDAARISRELLPVLATFRPI